MSGGESLASKMIRVLQSTSNGQLTERELDIQFSDNPREDHVEAINLLLRTNRLQLFTTGTGSLVYKLVSEDTAVKFDGLNSEQIMVYQICEKAGNKVLCGPHLPHISFTTHKHTHTYTHTHTHTYTHT